MFSFFKRKRNKWFNQESHDKAKENQTVSEKKLDLENDGTKMDSEQILHFDHLNFKLAVIQVLMYDLQVLKSSFDIYDFADQYSEEEIDTESMEVIRPALEYFEALSIPKKYAEEVKEIYMDGGNEIYMNIIPQWDGEDGTFDLNELSLSELQQFPNLKEATILSSNFDSMKEIFDVAGIEVDLL